MKTETNIQEQLKERYPDAIYLGTGDTLPECRVEYCYLLAMGWDEKVTYGGWLTNDNDHYACTPDTYKAIYGYEYDELKHKARVGLAKELPDAVFLGYGNEFPDGYSVEYFYCENWGGWVNGGWSGNSASCCYACTPETYTKIQGKLLLDATEQDQLKEIYDEVDEELELVLKDNIKLRNENRLLKKQISAMEDTLAQVLDDQDKADVLITKAQTCAQGLADILKRNL